MPKRLIGAGACALALLLGITATAQAGSVETLASGLNNPRGIAFAPNGALYVAEMGNGGPGVCIPSPAPPFLDRCYGETGAVTRIAPDGVPGFERLVTGLPSLALANGQAESGPAGLSFQGMAAYVTMGWGGDPRVRADLGGKAGLFGMLLRVLPSGQYAPIADIAWHEVRFNPAGGMIDSNPYGIVALPGRRVVADAGANALVEIAANGRTSTFAVPPRVAPGDREAVPTSVTQGPDGALYVGQLTGFPFFQGSSSVLRIASDGSSLETYAGGFTAVVGVAFDAGGALYVLEVARGQTPPFPPPNPGLGQGQLVRQCPGAAAEVLLDDLSYPGGIAIGPDQAVYLTNRGTSPDAGEVLRLAVAPCS
jgi:sugar lactone lactonase YvrE